MKKSSATVGTPVVTANIVALVCAGVWILLSSDVATIAIAILCLCLFVCLSLFFPHVPRLFRWSPSERCELCRKRRGKITGDMRWAEEFGLMTCNACSFTMHIAFGDPGAQHRSDMLH